MIADGKIAVAALAAPENVVRQFCEVWASGDIEGSMSFLADHCVYTLFIDGELLPVGGETAGRDNIEAGLRVLRQQFEYLLYRPRDINADSGRVRCQVEFMYRHRRSGEILSGRFRLVMHVEDGLIVTVHEYHDRARVEAFLRLYAN
jgi:ketosteroid isomerase-like protein